MTGYIPFLVAPSGTGISTYLKPWLQPEDAMTDMEDCYVYRGVIQKRYGFALYDSFPDGIGIYHLGTGDGTTTAFSGTLPYLPVGKKSLQILHTLAGSVISDGVDDGVGNITGTNIAAGSTINYSTGAIVLNFTTAPDNATGIRVNFGVRVAVGDGATLTFNFNLNSIIAGLPTGKRSLFIKNTATNQFSPTTFDAPGVMGVTGNLTNLLDGVTSGTITYATGAVTITFAVAPPAAAADQDIWARWEFPASSEPIKGIPYFWTSDSSQLTLVFNNTMMAYIDSANFKLTNLSGPNYFNTADRNFFCVANYIGRAFILNNSDRLTVWDGTFLTQPIVSFNSATPLHNDLTTGLMPWLYKNRLNILRPIENNTVKPQRDRYSALNNPFSWFSDVQGKGGFIEAASPEWIISAEFLRDEIISHFQESTWKLRYTGVDVAPYRWEKINDMRRIDAPYASVSYQGFETSLGLNGLLQCDGVNIERYDQNIIDFTTEEVDQNKIDICNSYRFDNLNQQLICYPSQQFGTLLTDYCDKWLVWNFAEDSFSKFNIPATCFGDYFSIFDLTWQDFNISNGFIHPGSNPPTDIEWGDFQEGENWLSYFSQGRAKIPVFGTKDGKIMEYFPFYATDNGVNAGFQFLTKDFNPFIEEGQRVTLGYIDFYFDRPSAASVIDPDYLLNIDFYVDENPVPILTLTLNPSEDDWQKKRVYVNITAQFHRFRVYLTPEQIQNSTVTTKGFVLNGYILWMQKGGRISGI